MGDPARETSGSLILVFVLYAAAAITGLVFALLDITRSPHHVYNSLLTASLLLNPVVVVVAMLQMWVHFEKGRVEHMRQVMRWPLIALMVTTACLALQAIIPALF